MVAELCFNENNQPMQDYDYDEGYMLDENYLDEFLDEEYEDAALTPYETSGQSDELYARLADSFETLNADTEGMSTEEAEDYITGEWIQAIIPLVTALAPVAAQAIGGLVSKLSNRSRPTRRPAPRPATRRPAPRPAPRPTPQPAANNQAILNTLLQALQDPRVIQVLQRSLGRR